LRGNGEVQPEVVSDQQDERLTARQRQIVALLVQGMTNKEIARVLDITEGTVKVHLHDIFQRLDVATRAKLAAKYVNGTA
jgi:two-component system nitrate/nitrite response regulator NarL